MKKQSYDVYITTVFGESLTWEVVAVNQLQAELLAQQFFPDNAHVVAVER